MDFWGYISVVLFMVWALRGRSVIDSLFRLCELEGVGCIMDRIMLSIFLMRGVL